MRIDSNTISYHNTRFIISKFRNYYYYLKFQKYLQIRTDRDIALLCFLLIVKLTLINKFN